ncbi:hypothetical protein C8J57DRAFT_270875 [Mycena rebaudengoi]|nr:hypothetical protein C8J57DRAFT_270875 [Mycena rebaudengoi]
MQPSQAHVLLACTRRSRGSAGNIFAAASAFNSAVTAATFFSLSGIRCQPKSYVLHLDQTILQSKITFPQHLSWSRLRRHNLLDSGVSGAVTGGILRGITAGRRTVVPAAITAGAACVALQAAYNELSIQRIKYVGKTLSQNSPSALQVPTPAVPQTTKPPLKNRILGLFGVKVLSNEELLVKLRRQRDSHLTRIRELEQELEQERTRNEKK